MALSLRARLPTYVATSWRLACIERRDGTPAQPAPPRASRAVKDRFLNRELSTIDFNARVLALAEDRDTPLLERAKFLAIFATQHWTSSSRCGSPA